MKIIIIGPVYPFKGGISHYSGLMASALAKKNNVEVISFKLQYPKLLYKRPQKDFENDSFKFENTKFLINTVNPFSALKTAGYIKKQAPDMVIFQWWHPFFVPVYLLVLRSLKKKFKVILLCHNVLPHELFPFAKKLTKSVLRRADAYIVHSGKDEEDLKSLINLPVYKKAVHPTYDAFNIEPVSYEHARAELKIEKSDEVLLFFGYIREYKGLKHLIHAMPSVLEQRANALLFIVGDFFEGNKEEYMKLIEESDCGERIRVYDGYTPDKEVGKYFSACDLVICPYESATQSGIVQIAYGFEKPVIATSVGGLPEVVIDGETGYLTQPCNSDSLAEATVRFLSKSADEKAVFVENIRKEADKYSWNRLVETVEELYNGL